MVTVFETVTEHKKKTDFKKNKYKIIFGRLDGPLRKISMMWMEKKMQHLQVSLLT
jgi:hypothetical protein